MLRVTKDSKNMVNVIPYHTKTIVPANINQVTMMLQTLDVGVEVRLDICNCDII